MGNRDSHCTKGTQNARHKRFLYRREQDIGAIPAAATASATAAASSFQGTSFLRKPRGHPSDGKATDGIAPRRACHARVAAALATPSRRSRTERRRSEKSYSPARLAAEVEPARRPQWPGLGSEGPESTNCTLAPGLERIMNDHRRQEAFRAKPF